MPDSAKKGDWVQIHQIVLEPNERPLHLPEDTKNVPLELWVKGFINTDGVIGDNVEITTVTGRVVYGRLTEINPGYPHGFGEYVPEIIHIGPQLKDILRGNLSSEVQPPVDEPSAKLDLRGY